MLAEMLKKLQRNKEEAGKIRNEIVLEMGKLWKASGIPVRTIGKESGIHYSVCHQILTGKRKPSTDSVMKLANYFLTK